MFSLSQLDYIELQPAGSIDTPVGGGWINRLAGNQLVVLNPDATGQPKWFFTTMTASRPDLGIYTQQMQIERHDIVRIGDLDLVSAGSVQATLAEYMGDQYIIVQRVPRHLVVFVLKQTDKEKVVDRMAWMTMHVTEMVRGSVTTFDELGKKRIPLFQPEELEIVPLGTEIHNNARDFGIVYYQAAVVKSALVKLPVLPNDNPNMQLSWMKVDDFGKGDQNPWIEETLEEPGYTVVYPRDFELSSAQDGFGWGMMHRLKLAGLIR